MKFNKLILNTKTRAPSLLALFILLGFFLPFSVSADINSGLVGYWTMDGKDINWSTNTLTDKSGNGNNGAITNMSTTTSPSQGHTGQSLKFDGVDDYISIPYAGLDFERTDPFSISAWVKFDDTHAQSIIGRSSLAGTRGTFFYRCKNVSLCNADGLAFALGNSGANAIVVKTPTSSFLPNVWTHVVVTYDGSSSASGVKIYKNATSLSLTTSLDTLSATIKPAVNWRIGDDYTNDWMKGSVDELRIFNRVLSAQDVAQLYKQGQSKIAQSAVRPTTDALSQGLVGYWTMDGKDINWGTNILNDRSSQANIGTIVGASTTTTPIAGKIGQALNINSTPARVDMGDPVNGSLDLSGDFSINIWTSSKGYLTRGSNYNYLLSKGTPNASGSAGYGIVQVSDNKIYFDAASSTSIAADRILVPFGSSPINDGVWHMLTVTNSNSITTLYKDSVSVGTSYVSGSLATALAFNLGSDTTTSRNCNCKIDDTRIYNRALSAQEINQLYKQGQSKVAQSAVRPTTDALSQGLVGYWTMDGKDTNWATNLVADKSGNGNSLVLFGLSTTTSPSQGKIGQAIHLTGFGGGFAYSNTQTGINMSQPMTISAWIKNDNNGAANEIIAHVGDASIQNEIRVLSTSQVAAETASSSSSALYGFSASVSNLHGYWHHVVGLFDGTGNYSNGGVVGYVDGVPFNTTVAGPNTNGGSNLTVGNRGLGGGIFTGSIDEVRIYNRRLSAQEISQLYKLGQSKNK